MKSLLFALVAVAAVAIFPPVASAHHGGFIARRQNSKAAALNAKAAKLNLLAAQQLNAHHAPQLQAVYVPVQQVYVPAQQLQQNAGCQALYR